MAHCSGCGPLIIVQLDPISHSIQIVLGPEAGREVSISLHMIMYSIHQNTVLIISVSVVLIQSIVLVVYLAN